MRSARRTPAGAPMQGLPAEEAEVGAARREAIGIVIATSAYGVSFGALAVASGLDVWQTCVLSLVMFTGGSQFAFVGVVGAGGLAALPRRSPPRRCSACGTSRMGSGCRP